MIGFLYKWHLKNAIFRTPTSLLQNQNQNQNQNQFKPTVRLPVTRLAWDGTVRPHACGTRVYVLDIEGWSFWMSVALLLRFLAPDVIQPDQPLQQPCACVDPADKVPPPTKYYQSMACP
jgi:hypothetical protein